MNFLKILIGVLAGLLVVLGVIMYLSQQNLRELEENLENCREEVRQLEDQLDDQAHLHEEEQTGNGNFVAFQPFTDYDLRQFERININEPVSFLRDRLQERPDLIPTEGVLGGTMNFYDREAIHVLNDKWMFATFEDGHIMGQLILSYDVGEDHEPEFEILAVSEK